MDLVSIAIALVVVGVLLWLANTYIPMSDMIKKVLNVTVLVVVVLWLVKVSGLLDYVRGIHM